MIFYMSICVWGGTTDRLRGRLIAQITHHVCRWWGLNNDELLRSEKGTICNVIGSLRNYDTPINLTQKERTDYVLDQ